MDYIARNVALSTPIAFTPEDVLRRMATAMMRLECVPVREVFELRPMNKEGGKGPAVSRYAVRRLLDCGLILAVAREDGRGDDFYLTAEGWRRGVEI
jgi:hypothetical protein